MTDLTPEKQHAKREVRDLIRDAGGIEAAAMDCRLGKSMLSLCGRPDNEHWMTVDAVMDLEDVTNGRSQHPRVTRMLAERQGFALVKLPTSETPTGDTLLAAIAEQARAANTVTAGMLDALADKVVTSAEARREMDNCFLAAERAMRLHALLSQIAEIG